MSCICLTDLLFNLHSPTMKGFFDEVEDLKYALHKSANLNIEYEKVLKSLCKKFDVEYSSLKINKSKTLRKKSKK